MKLLGSLSFIGFVFFLSGSVFADTGKAVYEKTCKMCHESGLAGAPKFGDKAAWKPRIATGLEALVKSAINGKASSTGMMPPRGGNPNLSDKELRSAVEFMVNNSK